MKSGIKVEILNNSHSQQYDIGRPVKPGTKGIVKERTAGGSWYVELIDPKDKQKVNIWFAEYDLLEIE